MMQTIFDADNIEQFPDRLPIFPLSNTILLPRSYLPLNIFEPRYLHMLEDAISNGRYMGIVQPLNSDPSPPSKIKGASAKRPALHQIGCLGRIIHFDEDPDGKFQIILKGEVRFKYLSDRELVTGYRLAKVEYDDFIDDLTIQSITLDRPKIRHLWQRYFDAHDLNVDWEGLEGASDERLVNTLAMLCPFQDVEKQALVESLHLQDRANLLNNLMEMSVLSHEMGNDSHQLQ